MGLTRNKSVFVLMLEIIVFDFVIGIPYFIHTAPFLCVENRIELRYEQAYQMRSKRLNYQ